MKNIYDYTQNQLIEEMAEIGAKKFRATQVFEWLYRKQATSFSEMSNLSLELREKLIKNYDIQILSLGQHYGLPTRLLDWSYSLYIAVYFAYSNVNKSRENVVIWALNKDHIIWQNSDAVLFTEHRVKENNNQKNQMGIFTLNKSLYNDLEEYAKQSTLISNISKKDALYKIIIPAKDKEVVLADLEQMGINSVKMFKGFEGCAKTALEKTISTISSKKI